MPVRLKAWLCMAYICLAWGTSYWAIKVGVMHYPALFFGGIRQALAGLVLCGVAWAVAGRPDFSMRNLGIQMWCGFLMLTLGKGGVTWAEQYVPTGITAIICSLMPIFAVGMELAYYRHRKPGAAPVAGMLLGTAGICLIFKNNMAVFGDVHYWLGMGAVFLATLGWAAGTLANKRNAGSRNQLFNCGLQLLFGGLFMLAISPVTDDYSHFDLWNPSGLMSIAYLGIFCSILAYPAYMFALKYLPVGVATLYAYVNPLVAVVLGCVMLGESMNLSVLLAFATILTGVFLACRGNIERKVALR